MKRIIALLLVFVLALTALVGCGKNKKFDYSKEDLTKYVTLGEYKGVAVTVVPEALTDEDIKECLDELLSENAVKTQIKDRAAADGDTVNIDYVGKRDGVAFEGGTASGASLTLGSNTYIDGFETGLVGVMPGETVELNLTFPANYHQASLAGAAVVFTVTLNYIDGVEIPEWNDEFVKTITTGKYETTEAYLEVLKKTWENDKKLGIEEKKIYDAWQAVLAGATMIEYPQVKVDEYKERLVSEYEYYAEYYKMTLEDFVVAASGLTMADFETYIDKNAKSLVAEDLVLHSIVKAEKIEVSAAEIQAGIEELAEYYGVTVAEFKANVDESQVKEQLLYDKVMLFISQNAKVTVSEE